MSLSDSKVGATIAVTDIDRAKQFYEGKLGLSPGDGEPPEAALYPCGEGSQLLVYASQYAGKTDATVATWEVSDLEATVDELTANGVEFEQYDEPMKTDEKGIFNDEGMGRIAWFKDPDGNTIAVGQFG